MNNMANGQTFTPPRPPASSLHPLLLLDEFLESLETTNAANEDTVKDDDQKVAANDENAAQALDKRRDYILRVADYLYGGSMLEASLAVLDTDGAIRQVTAHPSERQAFLVRGAASRQSRVTTDYFCLSSSGDNGIQYCSCRSYFERAKSDPKGLCKHLLALKLMKPLECPCRKETIPDAEFSGYLLRRMLPRDSADELRND